MDQNDIPAHSIESRSEDPPLSPGKPIVLTSLHQRRYIQDFSLPGIDYRYSLRAALLDDASDRPSVGRPAGIARAERFRQPALIRLIDVIYENVFYLVPMFVLICSLGLAEIFSVLRNIEARLDIMIDLLDFSV